MSKYRVVRVETELEDGVYTIRKKTRMASLS
jgi:hypothetical protein